MAKIEVEIPEIQSLICFLHVQELIQSSKTLEEIKQKMNVNIADLRETVLSKYHEMMHLTY